MSTLKTDFEVRESPTVNIVFGLLLSGVWLTSGIVSHFDVKVFLPASVLLIIPAVVLFAKASRKAVILRVNSTGIYCFEKLLTPWEYFIDARVGQDQVVMSIQDNFYLQIRCYTNGGNSVFTKKIALTNTQDKAEEEIIAAIKQHYQSWQVQRLDLRQISA